MEKERVGKVSRGNGQVEVDRGRIVWELIGRPSVEHAAEVWWSVGPSAYRKLELAQMRVGRRFCGQAIQYQEW